MKRFIAITLALVCVLSLAACDSASTPSAPQVNNGSANSGSSVTPGQSIVPGGEEILNEDGTMKIPEPTGGASFTIENDTWQTALAEDALKAALKDNSITTITSAASKEQYQMYYCAGGRYGSILKGNTYSETICGVQEGNVYVFNRSAADGAWTRSTYAGSYDEYVTNHYLVGPMQFFSGIASVYAQAKYVEAEKAYVVEQYAFSPAPEMSITGKLKLQFTGEKLYSITLYLNADGESGALTTVFGSAPAFELPTDFQSGNSGNISVSPDHNHNEPPEASCSESRWQQLFKAERLVDTFINDQLTAKFNNGQQEYLYQMSPHFSRIVLSDGGSYQEILINRNERFQRDSKDGQWLYYSGRTQHDAYDTIMSEKTAALTQLLTPLKDLYKDTTFDSPNRCFTLKNVTFNHSIFGASTGEYAVTIGGGMIEEIKATIQTGSGTVKLTVVRDKSEEIIPPTDYVAMDDGKPGKK